MVFCLICEDRVQQVLRDCCPDCKLQDVTIPLDDPVAIEALEQERDRSSKLILSVRLVRLISRTLTINVLSRRRVKLEQEEPLNREIRRVGFSPGTTDLSFGTLIPMPNAAQSLDPEGRFLAARPVAAIEIAVQTDASRDFSEHGNCSISGSSCADWDMVEPDPTPLLPQGRVALSPRPVRHHRHTHFP